MIYFKWWNSGAGFGGAKESESPKLEVLGKSVCQNKLIISPPTRFSVGTESEMMTWVSRQHVLNDSSRIKVVDAQCDISFHEKFKLVDQLSVLMVLLY